MSANDTDCPDDHLIDIDASSASIIALCTAVEIMFNEIQKFTKFHCAESHAIPILLTQIGAEAHRISAAAERLTELEVCDV